MTLGFEAMGGGAEADGPHAVSNMKTTVEGNTARMSIMVVARLSDVR
jgi:phage-related protein